MHRRSKCVFLRSDRFSTRTRSGEHHATRGVTLEPLKARTMLAATVWVNENWQNLTHPGLAPVLNDQVSNAFDTTAPGTIVKTYGVDAFGTIAGGQGTLPRIADAIICGVECRHGQSSWKAPMPKATSC